MDAFKVIIGAPVDGSLLPCPAIPSVTTVGPIEPHLEDITIASEQLFELMDVVFHIKGSAVERLMAVPRRQIHTHLQSLFTAGLCQFAQHIPLAVAKRAVAHAVVGIHRGPEAETIVMLGGDDDATQTGSLAGPCPLPGIESGGGEEAWRSVAISPFTVFKRVQPEVDEGIGLQLLPCHLTGRGQRLHRQWWLFFSPGEARRRHYSQDDGYISQCRSDGKFGHCVGDEGWPLEGYRYLQTR